jgi:hypothetical protein
VIVADVEASVIEAEVDEEHHEVEAAIEEEAGSLESEVAPKLSSSHTDIPAFSSLAAAKKISLSLKTSHLANPFMARSASQSTHPLHLASMVTTTQCRTQKSNTECGILSDRSWLQVSWVDWTLSS